MRNSGKSLSDRHKIVKFDLLEAEIIGSKVGNPTCKFSFREGLKKLEFSHLGEPSFFTFFPSFKNKYQNMFFSLHKNTGCLKENVS